MGVKKQALQHKGEAMKSHDDGEGRHLRVTWNAAHPAKNQSRLEPKHGRLSYISILYYIISTILIC